jgi:uncharacterized protein (DUF362 family)/Pyruvate/2-oxoacid:ferredoxin oxidoreductase delta subunit
MDRTVEVARPRVALVHCDSPEKAHAKARRIIELLGEEKIASLLRNKTVLLKPNCCIDYPPERGATTHPALVEAMIVVAKEYGAKVIVGDGPIVGIRADIFKATGMRDVCARHGVKLVNFNQGSGRRISIENARIYNEALIADAYFDAETVVNLPVFKSNMAYWLSGALKNMKGLLVAREKHVPHIKGVPLSVADLNRMVRQGLIVMDGIVGMMGNGPAAGKPAHAGLLIGGFDPVAVDAAAAVLMGFPAGKIPMIVYAEQNGVGSSNYELVGDDARSFRFPFEKPAIARRGLLAWLFESGLKRVFAFIQQRTRLVVDRSRCSLCGRCKTACPFEAVSISARAVQIDMKRCDLCLCCTEACAENAIELKGLLAKADAFMKN